MASKSFRLIIFPVLTLVLCVKFALCQHEDNLESVEDSYVEIDREMLKPMDSNKASRVLRSTYYLSKDKTDWISASEICKKDNLKLLDIEDLREDMEVAEFMRQEGVFKGWTSGKLHEKGYYFWGSTDKSFSYVNWSPAFQIDFTKPCVYFTMDPYKSEDKYFNWNVSRCEEKMYFVCEEQL